MKNFKTVCEAFEADQNALVLREFFTSMASGQFFDGRAHQLYLDLEAGRLFVRDESSLGMVSVPEPAVLVTQTQMGHCDLPDEELYQPGMDLEEFGFSDWVADMAQQVQLRLAPIADHHGANFGVLQ